MNWKRRAQALAAALVLAAPQAACIDEVTQPERIGVAAETNAMRLVMDGQPVITIYEDGKTSLGPVVFLRTATNQTVERPLRVELLDRSGNVIPNPSPDEVRINIGTASTAVANFLRTGPFEGTLRSTTTTLPNTTDLIVGLYDMKQRKVVIGPYTVRVTARLP